MIPEHLRPRLDIRTKVVSLVALSALVPTLVVGTASYLTARRILVEKVTNLISERASRAAVALQSWIQTHASEGDVFASSFLLVDNLERFAQASAREQRQVADQAKRTIEDYLVEVQARSPQVERLYVVGSDGVEVASTRGAGDVPAGDPAAQGISTGVEGEGNEARLVVRRLVGRPDEGPVGELLAITSMSELWKRLTMEVPPGGRLLVVEVQGMVRFDSENDPPGTLGGEASEIISRAASAGTGLASYRGESGRDLVVGYRYLPVQRLAVVLEMDQELSYEATYRLRDFILLICMLAAALITAVGYWVVLSFTDPIRALIAGAQAVAEGDLTQQIPVRAGDEIGYLTEVFNDMTRSLRETHAKLEELSITDELTGLVNRRHLGKLFQREIQRAERTGMPLAVLMLDLDHFKKFNDRFGHLAGDDLLRRLGGYFRDQLRPTDVSARYGGEEFALLLPGTREEEARATGERLRRGFSELPEDVRHGVTMSVGVAVHPGNGRSEEELLSAADAALYQAKREGRNRVVVAGVEPS